MPLRREVWKRRRDRHEALVAGLRREHLARGERAPDVELVSFEIHVAYFERSNLARSKIRVGGECNRMTSGSGASGSSLPTFGSLGSARRKECKGAVSGEVTKACETADNGLSSAVVAEIRGGLAIPTPEHLP